jgi:decaprenylphospho-beta-D-erythro-pentofuranosid-2-ulose 2-reductase
MTQGLKPAPLSTTPEAVAAVVVDAVRTQGARVAPAPLRFAMAGCATFATLFRRLPM